jgi:hypothetical protein
MSHKFRAHITNENGLFLFSTEWIEDKEKFIYAVDLLRENKKINVQTETSLNKTINLGSNQNEY